MSELGRSRLRPSNEAAATGRYRTEALGFMALLREGLYLAGVSPSGSSVRSDDTPAWGASVEATSWRGF
ncbi:MAG: hypothetical protein ACK4MF_03055 [Hyphomicrobiaceae bacterium]